MKRIVLNALGASLLLTGIPARADFAELKAYAHSRLSSALEYCKQIPVKSMVKTAATAGWNATKGLFHQINSHRYIAACTTAVAATTALVYAKKRYIKIQLNKAFSVDWDQCSSKEKTQTNPKFLQTVRRLYKININYEYLRDETKHIHVKDVLQQKFRKYLQAYDCNDKASMHISAQAILEALERQSIFTWLF